MDYISNSPEETAKIAGKFASELKEGDIVALYGNLGAGKTAFFKGIASGLGIKQRVNSPTFVFVKTYNIHGKTINHVDLYRSENLTDLSQIGLGEILSSEAITIIEWADRLEGKLPKKRIDIFFKILDEKSRKITIIRN